ncbi:MAG: 50S ribosomal protein L15 [Chloroflexi bacterium]|nr:50S ribosomal protein L15 [Chloroflexota bacterium]
MKQNELSPAAGSRKDRKRVGRGDGSGHGTYSGRGCKGEKARAGRGHMKPGFEGGQLPLIKRLPQKRGFVNLFRTEYSVVSIEKLSIFESGSEVTPDKLFAAGLVKSARQPVKVLSDGDIAYPLVVKAHKFSAAARAKIEAAGGKAEEVEYASAANQATASSGSD